MSKSAQDNFHRNFFNLSKKKNFNRENYEIS